MTQGNIAQNMYYYFKRENLAQSKKVIDQRKIEI